jgi:hypothetical protein
LRARCKSETKAYGFSAGLELKDGSEGTKFSLVTARNRPNSCTSIALNLDTIYKHLQILLNLVPYFNNKFSGDLSSNFSEKIIKSKTKPRNALSVQGGKEPEGNVLLPCKNVTQEKLSWHRSLRPTQNFNSAQEKTAEKNLQWHIP